MPEPKPVLLKSCPGYQPALSVVERRAYAAAHRILSEVTDHGERELVCPGGIRSRRVDAIARILKEEFSDA